VYERLPDKADILLKAGMTVIIDTAFLKKNDRMGQDWQNAIQCRLSWFRFPPR
jgi:predicted kinase